MKRLYFDTETTGFPQADGTPLEACPFIVQLAAILVDDEDEVASMNVIIKPAGWIVPDEAAAVHGISTEKAERCGISIRSAINLFSQLIKASDQVVAHNINFDRKLVSYEFQRYDKVDLLQKKELYCTMLATENICKLPGRYPGKFKWPKLIEAHQHLFGEGFDGAHDALVDVRACHRVHAELIRQGIA